MALSKLCVGMKKAAGEILLGAFCQACQNGLYVEK
jgi:hypothetical protein